MVVWESLSLSSALTQGLRRKPETGIIPLQVMSTVSATGKSVRGACTGLVKRAIHMICTSLEGRVISSFRTLLLQRMLSEARSVLGHATRSAPDETPEGVSGQAWPGKMQPQPIPPPCFTF